MSELATLAADPDRVEDVERDTLPGLIGEAAALHARLLAALHRPVEAEEPLASGHQEPDRLLTADQVAERLSVDRRWVYRRADRLPFTRRLSSGTLRFSERGLERWQESRR